MALKHLSETRDVKDFFSKLRKGDYINYHPSFDLEKIREWGRDHGWLIEYCTPDTHGYQKYGKYVCRVVSKLSMNMRTLDPVDIKTIAKEKDFNRKTWVKKKALKEFK